MTTAVLRVSTFSGDGVPKTSVIIWTDNVDILHEEFVSKGVQVDLGPTDQVWGLTRGSLPRCRREQAGLRAGPAHRVEWAATCSGRDVGNSETNDM